MCLRCTDNKMSISVGKHAGMSKLFWQSHPRFVCFALRVKNSGCLRYKSFSYLIFKLTSSAFFIRHFLNVCSCYFCAALCAKINLCKLRKFDVYSVYSVYARDKELVIAHWVVFAVCNGTIVFLLGSYRWCVRK